jgi:hypothetical protein
MSEWLLQNAGVETVSTDHILGVVLHLFYAFVLGAVLAYRPWRRLLGKPPVAHETAQMQTLIAIAGAVVVAIIGDSVARAFGLVGLGGFIRFRSGIKDPRDAAVMFLMIGIGMACGIGLVPLAAVTTGFAALLLLYFDRFGTARRERTRVIFLVEDPAGALPVLRRRFPGGRVISAPLGGSGARPLVLDLELPAPGDAAALHAEAVAAGVAGLSKVELVDE